MGVCILKLRCDYGIRTRMPPNAAHYAEDDVGEGKSVDVYPPVFGLLRATRAPDRSDDMAHAG
ncbi:MAG: hypothetical protein WA290_26810 [Mycobacterium sp.]|uniref:hypothetical protein n=1 Tax=Mycobacterium sp. TaxID=1785 RepID=UPI003C78312C